MVLPEDLCHRLTALAKQESRTVSNMAKVLIQEGVKYYEQIQSAQADISEEVTSTEQFRSALEAQETKRLRGAPRRIKLQKP